MTNLTDQAYAYIHQLILNGELKPGDIITESVVADRLGMSRTPVGEAIRQLVREGLVDQVPRKGAILRNFGRTDLIDMFDMRQAVEPFAAGKIADQVTSKQIDKLNALSSAMKRLSQTARNEGKAVLSGDPMQQLFSADMTFHMLILQDTGNPRMQQAVAETRAVFSVFRIQRPQLDLRVVEEAHEDHDGIIQAFRNRQSEQARAIMEAHIIKSRKYVLQELDLEASQRRTPEHFLGNLPSELLDELERIDQEK